MNQTVNEGNDYPTRWKNNTNLTEQKLLDFIEKMHVPYIRNTVVEVCMETGVAFRESELNENPTINDLVGTIRSPRYRNQRFLHRKIFLSHYLAKDNVLRYIEPKADRSEAGTPTPALAER